MSRFTSERSTKRHRITVLVTGRDVASLGRVCDWVSVAAGYSLSSSSWWIPRCSRLDEIYNPSSELWVYQGSVPRCPGYLQRKTMAKPPPSSALSSSPPEEIHTDVLDLQPQVRVGASGTVRYSGTPLFHQIACMSQHVSQSIFPLLLDLMFSHCSTRGSGSQPSFSNREPRPQTWDKFWNWENSELSFVQI